MPMPRSLPRLRRFVAALVEAGVVGRLQRHVERGEIIAAVIGERDRRLIGIGVLGDEVAPAQFGRVDLQLARRHVDDALDDIAGFRAVRRRDRRRPARCW